MFGPLICKPQSSRSNKTGAWRTESKPKFLKKNCIACNMCVLICPEGCIAGSGKNTYDCDLDYCKGCGNCALLCPKQDILMVKEEG
jgi:2-oxoacid:acceptor oxidoreductase delta subunit (pyruvate/2-ketoisovalerate family)